MAISGTITLGTDTTSNMTSFDLYPCTSSSNSSCSGTAFDTNVSRASLISGFQTNNIPDGTLYIKINSTNTGPCKDANPAIIELSGAPLQVSLSPTPTLTKTPTPTPTIPEQSNGICYTLTYSTVPNDLYVRYRSKIDDIVKTELITSLESMDNGDNTYTAAICVSQITPYNVPVFVQNGIEISGGNYIWESGGSCTTNGTCFLNDESGGPITFTAVPSCVGYAPTGVTITIDNATGGSGTGYYVVMTSPSGNDTPHNLPYAYSGLDNYVGNTYAFTVYDSTNTPSSNVALTQDYSCAAAPNNTASANLVIQSTKPNSSQCSSGTPYTFDLGSPAATFCTATTFTALGLTGLGTGNNYWLCYDGQTRQVFHPSNAGYFQSAGGCQTI
jgi:hypothetical protein